MSSSLSDSLSSSASSSSAGIYVGDGGGMEGGMGGNNKDRFSGADSSALISTSYSVRLPRTVEAKLLELVRGLRERSDDRDRRGDMAHTLAEIREEVAGIRFEKEAGTFFP